MIFGTSKRTVKRLPDDGSGNAWYETLPPPPPPTRVNDDVRTDWVIIGAGACGLAAARRLAELRHQDRIALVDATRLGFGASGRNAGFILDHNTHGKVKDYDVERRNSILCAAGVDYLRDLVRENQIQCQWSDWGRVYVSAGKSGDLHLSELAENYDILGVDYDWIERHALGAMTGSGIYMRGLRAYGSALVQPAALMRGLGETLPANVTLYEDSPVTSIARDQQFRLTCPNGTIVADRLILANSVFAEEMGVFRFRVVPIATFGSLTRPLDPSEMDELGSEREFGLLPANPNGSTVRLTQDKRILIRNSFAYAREKATTDEILHRVRGKHREALRKRWPGLSDVPFVGTWRGILGFTRNDGTIFGRIDDGVYAVISSDASPVSRGSIAGKLLGEEICGIESELLDVMRSIPKAGLLPPDPILKMVVNQKLRWIEKHGADEL